MAKNSNIEWTTHTFNGWRGCTKVSPGCAHCYAEKLVTQRLRGEWGPGKPRQLASDAMWREPLAWNREAAEAEAAHASEAPLHDAGDLAPYERPRVFCSSLADVFDAEIPVEWLARLLRLIEATPHLDWLLLTKRPQHWRSRLEAVCEIDGDSIAWPWLRGTAPANIWIGTSVEDQQRADERIPELLSIPARVRFLSCEPLLGPVDISFGLPAADAHMGEDLVASGKNIDWVIVGGESGPAARPMHPAWARSLRDQCATAGVPFFFKQWGEWIPGDHVEDLPDHEPKRITHLALDGTVASSTHMPFEKRDGMQTICLVGKKTAGRLLDGIEHNGYPTA